MSAADEIRLDHLEDNQKKLFKFMEEVIERLTKIETILEMSPKAGCGSECVRQNDRIDKLEKAHLELEKQVLKISVLISSVIGVVGWALQTFVK